ncbi:MAG: hypothetical protein FWD15_02430 [Alphaproteobacteria bacterium]|nr:hypothetical protein [Alphaproteobacteria bacterium]
MQRILTTEDYIDALIAAGIFKLAKDDNEDNWFKLKAGGKSPIFWNVKEIQDDPKLLKTTVAFMNKRLKQAGVKFDKVVPIPDGANVIGAWLGYKADKAIITVPKDEKDHGADAGRKYIGKIVPGHKIVLAEDVSTTSLSAVQMVEKVRKFGLSDEEIAAGKLNLVKVEAVASVINREQGSTENLAAIGVKLVSVVNQMDAIKHAISTDNPMYGVVMRYLEQNVKKK